MQPPSASREGCFCVKWNHGTARDGDDRPRMGSGFGWTLLLFGLRLSFCGPNRSDRRYWVLLSELAYIRKHLFNVVIELRRVCLSKGFEFVHDFIRDRGVR